MYKVYQPKDIIEILLDENVWQGWHRESDGDDEVEDFSYKD